jgi:ribosomal-protein-alanine N-acetyltransferase
MATGPTLETERLLLRRWKSKDRLSFARINADPDVMEHFPAPLTAEESDQMVRRIDRQFEEFGFGLWAVEIKWAHKFIGFCGLAVPTFQTHFTPAVEIGWRFAKDQWGSGYATEAATAVLEFGFGDAGLDRVLSWTIPANRRSRQVMERLGMKRAPELDFDHPRFLHNERLKRHVVYQITAADWPESRRRDRG